MTIQSKPESYYEGCNPKLLHALPQGRKAVLELGCANGELGRAYKSMNPDCVWTGLDVNETSLTQAAHKLDSALHFDLNHYTDDAFQALGEFDLIVFGDLIEHMLEPERLVRNIWAVAAPDASIVCCIPNMTNIQVVTKMLGGDLSYDTMGLLDNTHTRFFSPASVQKMMLDAGWLPSLVDSYTSQLSGDNFTAALVLAASCLKVPSDTALRNLGLYQMIYRCEKLAAPAREPATSLQVSVVVPVTNQLQFSENILKSPGLSEIDCEILPVQNATSAADAYERGRRAARHDWVLYCHQDMYFPAGSGLQIARELEALAARGATNGPIGFIGLGEDEAGAYGVRGLIVDRVHILDHPASPRANCLDECAVLLHKDTRVRLDPALGWHLWATDLCLQALIDDETTDAVVLRVPVFHNSVSTQHLPQAFHDSGIALLDKYGVLDRVDTLNGVISRPHARQASAAG